VKYYPYYLKAKVIFISFYSCCKNFAKARLDKKQKTPQNRERFGKAISKKILELNKLYSRQFRAIVRQQQKKRGRYSQIIKVMFISYSENQ